MLAAAAVGFAGGLAAEAEAWCEQEGPWAALVAAAYLGPWLAVVAAFPILSIQTMLACLA